MIIYSFHTLDGSGDCWENVGYWMDEEQAWKDLIEMGYGEEYVSKGIFTIEVKETKPNIPTGLEGK